MRCPSCQVENEDKVKKCAGCGATLRTRKPRRRDDPDAPLSAEAERYNREVMSLYRWCLLALVPVAGLVVGPLVAYRAHRFRKKVAGDAAMAGAIPVDLALWVGVASGLLSWVGLILLLLGVGMQ